MILTEQVKEHIKKFKQLILGKNSEDNSRLLSEKFSSELSSIPELISYIDNKDVNEKKIILGELGTFLQVKEFNKGTILRKIYDSNYDFIMLLKGKIMEFEIKYITTYISFQDYILFITKLFLLNEKYLYWDCIEKNYEAFPFNTFKYFIENWKEGLKFYEDEKNECKNLIKGINVINICKEINMKNFDYMEELEKIKYNIKNSEWNNFILKNDGLTEEEYIKMINSFFNLYNFNFDIDVNEKSSIEELKYKVCLPYFYKKRILNPISFIGDLNRPSKMKNYSSFICLDNCFAIYINKLKIGPTRLLYKYIYNNKVNYIEENLFKKHHIFKNINEEYLRNFGKYMQIINLKKNEILFKQGEPHKGVYIILKGSLQLDSYQSYRDLIYVNFLLMHSLDYYPEYISSNRKNEIEIDYNNFKKNKSYFNNFYDYNTDLNILMKNPLFKEKSIIKENIIFCIYKKNEILGLGEIFNYKLNTKIFSAKSLNNNTEVIFIPKEIFQALLSIKSICNKCGNLTEEKADILNRCIEKHKKIFEKKIQMLVNPRKISLYNNRGKDLFKKIQNLANNINKNSYIFSSNNKILNNNKQNDENDKNNNSNQSKSIILDNNDTNKIDLNEANKADHNQEISIKNYIIRNKTQTILGNKKYILNENNEKILLNSQFPTISKQPIINKRNRILHSAVSSVGNNNINIKKRIEEFANLYSGKKIKRISGPIFLSYDSCFNSENQKNDLINLKYKSKRKEKKRILSAKRYDEQDVKKSILNYQNSVKEMNKYYNNIYQKGCKSNTRSYFPKSINLNKSSNNKDEKNLSFHKKKIIINKFSPTILFKKKN